MLIFQAHIHVRLINSACYFIKHKKSVYTVQGFYDASAEHFALLLMLHALKE